MAKQFLTSPDATFLNLQSGNASPYIYIEAIISSVTSVIADSFTSANFLIDGGQIDREKPALPGDRSSIFSSDVTLKVDNSSNRFSPKDQSGAFFGNIYLHSPVNYWAGFLNVSGTALLVQRGSFVLDSVRLDARQGVAYLRLRDKFHVSLSSIIGGTDISGTATEYVTTGIIDGKGVLEQLFITGAGLTAGDLNIQTAGITFKNLSFSEQSVADAASLVSEASDGYLFTNRSGKLTFVSNAPVHGSATATFTITQSNYAQNLFYEDSQDNLLSKVTVEYQSGTSITVVSQFTATTAMTANTLNISNDTIQSYPEAIAIAGRTRDRFSGVASTIEIQAVWLPSLDLDDRLTVSVTAAGLSGHTFRIYKVQEEPSVGVMSIFAISERATKNLTDNKFGFFSDPSAANPSGGAFTGGASELNGWQNHWGFFVVDNVTGFDDDGDNNNALNTSVASSGAGSTGIEVPFLYY